MMPGMSHQTQCHLLLVAWPYEQRIAKEARDKTKKEKSIAAHMAKLQEEGDIEFDATFLASFMHQVPQDSQETIDIPMGESICLNEGYGLKLNGNASLTAKYDSKVAPGIFAANYKSAEKTILAPGISAEDFNKLYRVNGYRTANSTNHVYKCDATVKVAIKAGDDKDMIVNPVFSALAKAGGKYGGYEWALDTGTNRHITNDMADFVPGTYTLKHAKVAVGSGSTESPGYGDVILHADTRLIRLRNVVLPPNCPIKLMAASPFVRGGCTIKIADKNSLTVTQGSTVVLRGKDIGGLYGVEVTLWEIHFS
mgnify:CR=1 FL=1